MTTVVKTVDATVSCRGLTTIFERKKHGQCKLLVGYFAVFERDATTDRWRRVPELLRLVLDPVWHVSLASPFFAHRVTTRQAGRDLGRIVTWHGIEDDNTSYFDQVVLRGHAIKGAGIVNAARTFVQDWTTYGTAASATISADPLETVDQTPLRTHKTEAEAYPDHRHASSSYADLVAQLDGDRANAARWPYYRLTALRALWQLSQNLRLDASVLQLSDVTLQAMAAGRYVPPRLVDGLGPLLTAYVRQHATVATALLERYVVWWRAQAFDRAGVPMVLARPNHVERHTGTRDLKALGALSLRGGLDGGGDARADIVLPAGRAYGGAILVRPPLTKLLDEFALLRTLFAELGGRLVLQSLMDVLSPAASSPPPMTKRWTTLEVVVDGRQPCNMHAWAATPPQAFCHVAITHAHHFATRDLQQLLGLIAQKRAQLAPASQTHTSLEVKGCPVLALVNPRHPMLPGSGTSALRVLADVPLEAHWDFAQPPWTALKAWFAKQPAPPHDGLRRPGRVPSLAAALGEHLAAPTRVLVTYLAESPTLDELYAALYLRAIAPAHIYVGGLSAKLLSGEQWLPMSRYYFTDCDLMLSK